MKRSGMLLCLIGPSGGGKTTFVMRLLQEEGAAAKLSISLTTRAPRPQEQEGVHYYFVSREDFMQRVERGEIFEWEEVHGNCYGTLKRTVDEAIQSGVDLILDIDIRGALNFKRAFPGNAVIVFLAPPSVEVLLERIKGRSAVGTEEIERRLATAAREYGALLGLQQQPGSIDYFVVNRDLENTYAQIRAIVQAERARLSRLDQAEVRAICRTD